MDWSNLGYVVLFGAMAFMMFRGGGCCGGGNRRGHTDGQSKDSHSGHSGCCGGGSVPEPRQPSNMADNSATTQFIVEGMTCQHCAGTVEKALLGKPGVSGARVSLADKKAEVAFDPAVITVESLKQAVREAGYQPE